MSSIEIITAIAAIIAAGASLCAPIVTAIAQVFFFAMMRFIRERLVPKAPPNAINSDSKLECKFIPPENIV